MRRLTIQLFVAVLTFAVGTGASLLLRGVFSPTPEKASSSSNVISRHPPSLTGSKRKYLEETISSRCECSESFSEADQVAPKAPIDGGVLNGRAINLPKPAYPSIARAARASGTVPVRIVVDENGCVENARALGGHPLLQAAAVEAARHACFAPTRLSGEPVKVTGFVTYNFVIE